MATAPSARSRTLPAIANRQASAVRVVDADLHHQVVDWRAVAPHVPEGLRWRVTQQGGPPMARNGYRKVGAAFGEAPIPPPVDGRRRHPAADPRWVKEQYLDRRGVDVAILTGSLLGLGVQSNADVAAALARGVNDWTLETWVRPFDCYKGSILVAQQDPGQAVAEIDRLGDDPGMVQVLVSSAAQLPLGHRSYHPIYEACARHGLPLAVHLGGEGAGNSPPASAVGHPTTYLEWYCDLPQTYMSHLTSMVSEAVFERYPTLKVVLYEGGLFWLPHLMWRFDKNWKSQRAEVPWVTRPPSQYLLEHVHSTTYPLEAAPDPRYLHEVLEMVRADRRLLFSSNYPNWEYGDPFEMIRDLPSAIRRRVLVENALELYGQRLLAPSV